MQGNLHVRFGVGVGVQLPGLHHVFCRRRRSPRPTSIAIPYHPRPIWDNFRGLFQAINAGNEMLGIPAYNGGLFAPDDDPGSAPGARRGLRLLPRPGAVRLPARPRGGDRCRRDRRGSLVDVDILGHIFEQSITDLEKIRSELDERTAPPERREAQIAAEEGRRVLYAGLHHPLQRQPGPGRRAA